MSKVFQCSVFKSSLQSRINLITNLPKHSVTAKHFSSNKETNDTAQSENEKPSKLGGFAKAFEKYTAPAVDKPEPVDNQTFASLLRKSKLIDLGDPEGKVVTGKIFHVVDDDLYVDFGWKFHAVCPRPPKNSSEYVRGARVRLRIKELELSTRFLGSNKDLTLMEADATIIGIVSSPAREQQYSRSKQ